MFRVVFIIVALRDPSLGREGSIKPQQFFHYLVPSSVYLCIFGANFSKRTRGKSIGDIERIQRSLYSSENMKLFSVSFWIFCHNSSCAGEIACFRETIQKNNCVQGQSNVTLK